MNVYVLCMLREILTVLVTLLLIFMKEILGQLFPIERNSHSELYRWLTPLVSTIVSTESWRDGMVYIFANLDSSNECNDQWILFSFSCIKELTTPL